MKYRLLPSRHLIVLLAVAALVFSSGCSTLSVILSGTVGTPPPSERPPAPRSTGGHPSYRSLHIPPGHLPPPGSCKIWEPGGPPGHQGPPMDCREAFRKVPPGYWVLERLNSDETLLHVHEAHPKRPGIIVEVEIYSLQ
ncbi:MAG: hypothetical protein OEX02_02685 [Cyclobacteriaceae bacterium]|nr:hypothetical protein [Cyclobacteriaceae bacterium]